MFRQAWWCVPVNPTSREAEAGEFWVQPDKSKQNQKTHVEAWECSTALVHEWDCGGPGTKKDHNSYAGYKPQSDGGVKSWGLWEVGLAPFRWSLLGAAWPVSCHGGHSACPSEVRQPGSIWEASASVALTEGTCHCPELGLQPLALWETHVCCTSQFWGFCYSRRNKLGHCISVCLVVIAECFYIFPSWGYL